jgi:hypothetical protein
MLTIGNTIPNDPNLKFEWSLYCPQNSEDIAEASYVVAKKVRLLAK